MPPNKWKRRVSRPGGEYAIRNGLLLRRDLHAVFDRGYLSVSPELRVRVSRRIREEFENGHEYYAMNDRELQPTRDRSLMPDVELLRWHLGEKFRG